ncbi:MAG: accessory factor UbiK family protein [Alphaproteobacteria bacterium]|nr:accessory factor UbiK family protein [Alphaproteobacteria bacterium]
MIFKDKIAEKLNTGKILGDAARFAGGAAGALSGLRQTIRQEVRARIDELGTRLDFVPREDFENLQTMVRELRERQDEILKRLDTPLSPKPSSGAAKKKTPARKQD